MIEKNVILEKIIPEVITKNGTFPYNPNKIYKSLLHETDISKFSAKDITKTVSRFLISHKFRFVTAPMIREIVNFFLLQRGFERYRLQYTRIGLPFTDIDNLLSYTDQNHIKDKIYEWIETEYLSVANLIADKKL